MSRTRVLDLAKELGLETRIAIIKLQELGIQVKNHFNAISDVDAAKLRALHRSGKTPEKIASQKQANKIIIRRKTNEVSAHDQGDLLQHPEALHADEHGSHPEAGHADESMGSEEVYQAPEPSHTPHVEPLEAERPVLTEKSAPEAVPLQVHTQQQAEISVPSAMVEAPARASEPVADAIPVPSAPPAKADAAESATTAPSSAPKPSTAEPARPATAPRAAQPSSNAAVIVRRAEPSPTPPPYGRNDGQGYGSRSPQGGGGYRGNDNNAGRRGPPFTPNQQGGGGGGYGQNNASGQGNYTQNAQGGYRRGNEPGQQQQSTGAYAGRTGQNPAYGPSAGNQQRPSYVSGTRPSYPGAPAPSKPFVMSDTMASTNTKSVPSRLKYPDKERDKKKSLEEIDARGKLAARVKNRFDEDFVEDGDTPVEQEGQIVRTLIPNRRKPAHRRKETRQQELANPTKASKKVLRIDGSITVNDLAAEMSLKASVVIKALMKLGMMASVNQQLDFDTANFVAQEFGFETQNATVSIGDILTRKTDKNQALNQEQRPPIVTIMGHVDHGKTSLLDAIRTTRVAAKEAGGITQHIGAYQIESKGRKLTFLDTPGHEAFTAMRGRGAKVTDIVVLVVAADDGVMPQTIEAIAHAKAAQVPIIVAINKIDKPGIDIERITRELADQGILPEEWGGDALFVQVSAKTGVGIDNLIDTILLQAEILDLKASLEGFAEGIVIEAKLDKARGPVVTVMVMQGILKQQDYIVIGKCSGRIRAIHDDRGQKIAQAGPATPVEIIGIDGVPESGDHFNCVASDAIAREAVAFRIEKQRQKDVASQKGSTMEELFAQMGLATENKPKELPVIIKADTHGSAEAIKTSLLKLSTPKVKTRIIHTAVGGITETDAILAQASNAIIVGFNVRPDKMASQFAERNGVIIQLFSIIYQLTDAIQAAMLGTLAPVKQDKILGHAQVRSLFSVPKIGVIAGSMVIDGKIIRNSHARVVRDGVVIYTGRVGSLRRFKDDAKEVLQGFECGIGVENYNDLKVDDVIESFIIEEIAPTLA